MTPVIIDIDVMITSVNTIVELIHMRMLHWPLRRVTHDSNHECIKGCHSCKNQYDSTNDNELIVMNDNTKLEITERLQMTLALRKVTHDTRSISNKWTATPLRVVMVIMIVMNINH